MYPAESRRGFEDIPGISKTVTKEVESRAGKHGGNRKHREEKPKQHVAVVYFTNAALVTVHG